MKRKTVKIDDLKERANNMLQYSCCGPDFRRGVTAMIDTVLLQAGVYRGFRYLTKNDLTSGVTPGINLDHDGQCAADIDARFANTDDTRRYYY